MKHVAIIFLFSVILLMTMGCHLTDTSRLAKVQTEAGQLKESTINGAISTNSVKKGQMQLVQKKVNSPLESGMEKDITKIEDAGVDVGMVEKLRYDLSESNVDIDPSEDKVPPALIGNGELARMGYVNVTLYGADATGVKDSTESIRRAIQDAYDYNMAVFFPSGTYIVSDTLELCVSKGTFHNIKRRGHVLIGSTSGSSRPVIKLKDNALGFDGKDGRFAAQDKKTKLKPVIYFWKQNHDIPNQAKANENYNQVIRGIDIDLGNGNFGAVGIHHRGCEGSAITDVKIKAGDAYAGIFDLLGSGGSITNLEVDGGRYGIYAPGSQETPLLTGISLTNQKELAIYYKGFNPLTVVGMYITKDKGAVIGLEIGYHKENPEEGCGNLSLIDASIELTSGSLHDTIIQNTDRSIYMKDVYIKSAGKVLSNSMDDTDIKVGDISKWTRVKELAYNKAYDTPVKIINGKATSDMLIDMESIAAKPPTDLISRHVWSDGEKFCAFDVLDVINVKDYGAKGDGITDDTAAIQAAVEAGVKVFLPRGVYRTTKTLKLKSNTQLFGVARHISILSPDWNAYEETPAIVTPDDAAATTTLSSFKIVLPQSSKKVYGIRWMAGANSIVRDVWVGSLPEHKANQPLRWTIITGNGGGKWYNHLGIGQFDSRNPRSRIVVAERTSQPLTFYHFHNQHANCEGEAMSEIINSSNVTIFALKSEDSYVKEQQPSSLRVIDSNNITIIGYGGNMAAAPGRGIIELINCKNVLVANMGRYMKGVRSPESYYYIKDTYSNKTNTINAQTIVNLIKRSE